MLHSVYIYIYQSFHPKTTSNLTPLITGALHTGPRVTRQVAESEDTFQIVLLGDEVSFDCAVESEDVTEVSIWWQKDGENITAEEDKFSMEVGVEAGLGLVTSQLVVSSIAWEDAGVYNCRARDGTEGRIEKNKATLSVQGEWNIYCDRMKI